MAAVIDETQVRRIAKLARLSLGLDEVRLFTSQLGSVLDYVDQLKALDTEGIEPLAHAIPITDVLRCDLPRAGLSQRQALANAPQTLDGFFRVPAVLANNPD